MGAEGMSASRVFFGVSLSASLSASLAKQPVAAMPETQAEQQK